MKFRLLNKWYANINGYFWLPCPLCNQYFGGQEWIKGFDNLIEDINKPPRVIRICPDCAKKGLGNTMEENKCGKN